MYVFENRKNEFVCSFFVENYLNFLFNYIEIFDQIFNKLKLNVIQLFQLSNLVRRRDIMK